jgi:hypothetical protein
MMFRQNTPGGSSSYNAKNGGGFEEESQNQGFSGL